MPPESSHAPVDTVVFDGLALANAMRSQLAEEIHELTKAGHRPPCLTVVLVGDDPASRSYIKGKQRACARIGMDAVEHLLPGSTSQSELLALIETINADDRIDGILVQLPLPAHIRPAVIAEAIDPAKDADALHPDQRRTSAGGHLGARLVHSARHPGDPRPPRRSRSKARRPS